MPATDPVLDPWTSGVPPLSACPDDPLDLSGSESPFGCSPQAAQRVARAVRACHQDTREAVAALRAALSRRYNLAADRITVAAGTRALLPALAAVLCEEGRALAVSEPCPPLHALAARQSGLPTLAIPLQGMAYDVDECMGVVRRGAVLLLAHPHNPTGAWLPRDAMHALVSAARDTYVVVDEAYADYADAEDFPRVAALLDDFPNLVVVRTFSSLHGLAGLPAAYALSHPDLASRLQRRLLGSEPGEVAAWAAATAIEDASFEAMVADRVRRARFRARRALEEMKVGIHVGQGPWIMAAASNAADAARRFAARGVRVRDLTAWGWPGWVRARAAVDEDLDVFLEAARHVLKV